MFQRIPVAVLGATGSVGQRFIQLLENHPWFEVTALTGSDRTTGKCYGDAVHWLFPTPLPAAAARLPILPSDPAVLPAVQIAFSALPADIALQVEPAFAAAGVWVCSNASAFRREEDVPILLPEVNPQHLQLLAEQTARRGWKAGIITNPNCTSTGLTVVLKALQDSFGLRRASVVSLQALSGAGYPGVSALDILDNTIPWISGEEEKLEWEPRKMLGEFSSGSITLVPITLSAQVNRVAVSDGHTVCLAVDLDQPVPPEQVAEALSAFHLPELSLQLPSAPTPPILARREADRPQPRLDRDTGKGMTTVVGRIRRDSIFHLRMVILSHNTIRGAAGGAIYNAELLARTQGLC